MSWNVKTKSRLPESVISEYRYIFGNMILVDVKPEYVSDVLDCVKYNIPIQFQPLTILTEILRIQIPFENYERILWPGTGAKTVRALLQMQDVGEFIDAKRVGYKDPTFEIGDVDERDQKTLIIDDVICSGGTVRAIKDKAKIKNCDIACLVMQSPRNCDLKIFSKIFTPLVIRAKQGKPPLNSLSTFLKNQDIALDYAKRFVCNPDEFLEALSLIKEEAEFYA